MSASTGERLGEWDELPLDGSDAWMGVLLMAASAVGTIKALGWIMTVAHGFIMR